MYTISVISVLERQDYNCMRLQNYVEHFPKRLCSKKETSYLYPHNLPRWISLQCISMSSNINEDVRSKTHAPLHCHTSSFTLTVTAEKWQIAIFGFCKKVIRLPLNESPSFKDMIRCDEAVSGLCHSE